jgi:hypothetical protein
LGRGKGKLIWAEKEKEKEIEDGFGTFVFFNNTTTSKTNAKA